jgi:RNA polymerase sigma factor (sigma-70 family)
MASPPAGQLLRHLCRLLQPDGRTAPTDRQLLERFTAARDEGSFAALVDRHGGLVLGVCRRLLGDAHEAEDIFQATFLVLACKAPNIRKREAVSSWLHGVALRLARKARARRARRRECAAQEAVAGEDVANGIAREEVRRLLDEELQRLPARYRVPLVLCYLEGKSRQEAAAELGCSEGSVKGKLERGREMLRVRLLRRGVTVVPATLATQQAGAAVPAAWAAAAVQASSGRVVSATASALAHGLLRTMTATKVKALAGVLLLLGMASAALIPAVRPTPATDTNGDNGGAGLPEPARFVGFAHSGRLPGSLPRGFTAYCATCHTASAGLPGEPDEGPNLVRTALSADGRALATAGTDGRVRVWDMTSCTTAPRLEVAAPDCSALAFTPDSKRLAVADGRPGVGLWDLAAGHEVRRLGKGRADALAFSPDGQTLATATRGTINLLDVGEGQERPFLDMPGEACAALAFAPDGRTLATRTTTGPVRLWDVASGREKGCVPASGSPGGTLAFTADGRFLALANRRGGARVWEVETGRVCAAGVEVESLPLSSGGSRPPLAAETGTQFFSASLDLVTVALSADGRSLRRTGLTTTALVRSTIALWPCCPTP